MRDLGDTELHTLVEHYGLDLNPPGSYSSKYSHLGDSDYKGFLTQLQSEFAGFDFGEGSPLREDYNRFMQPYQQKRLEELQSGQQENKYNAGLVGANKWLEQKGQLPSGFTEHAMNSPEDPVYKNIVPQLMKSAAQQSGTQNVQMTPDEQQAIDDQEKNKGLLSSVPPGQPLNQQVNQGNSTSGQN